MKNIFIVLVVILIMIAIYGLLTNDSFNKLTLIGKVVLLSWGFTGVLFYFLYDRIYFNQRSSARKVKIMGYQAVMVYFILTGAVWLLIRDYAFLKNIYVY